MNRKQSEFARHERAKLILRIMEAMQGSRDGLSLEDIRNIAAPYYKSGWPSRKTAERVRDDVRDLRPSMDEVHLPWERVKRWRIPSCTIKFCVSAHEVADLKIAAELCERDGLPDHAETLRRFIAHILASVGDGALRRLDPDLEALEQHEHVVPVHKNRKRPSIAHILKIVRDALVSSRCIALQCRGVVESVQPYGLVHGCNTGSCLVAQAGSQFRGYSLSDVERAELGGFFIRQPVSREALESVAKRASSLDGRIPAEHHTRPSPA